MYKSFDAIREIGRGSFSVVYEGVNRHLPEQKVAIKVLSSSVQPDITRFFQEVKLLAELENPFIATLHDWGKCPNGFFLVMRLYRESLASRIKNSSPLPLREAAQYLRDILRGLDYAHCRDVVHRDLKPGNLLLDAAGNVVIADLGLALMLTDRLNLTLPTQWLGTPGYMPPEVWNHRPWDVRGDLYSFGCIMYELLCGRPPFVADSLVNYSKAHAEGVVPPISDFRSDVPEAWAELLTTLLAKDPAERPTSARVARLLLDGLASPQRTSPVVPSEEASKRISTAAFEGASHLELAELGLAEVPSEAFNLTLLRSLDLKHNNLRNLPPDIGRLANLEVLNLTRNSLEYLPRELLQLKSLRRIILHGNPALRIPKRLLGKTWTQGYCDVNARAVLDYYFATVAY